MTDHRVYFPPPESRGCASGREFGGADVTRRVKLAGPGWSWERQFSAGLELGLCCLLCLSSERTASMFYSEPSQRHVIFPSSSSGQVACSLRPRRQQSSPPFPVSRRGWRQGISALLLTPWRSPFGNKMTPEFTVRRTPGAPGALLACDDHCRDRRSLANLAVSCFQRCDHCRSL